jgi:hypothetical protein
MQKFYQQYGARVEEGFNFCDQYGAKNTNDITPDTVSALQCPGLARKGIRWDRVINAMGLIILSLVATGFILGIIINVSKSDVLNDSSLLIMIFASVMGMFIGSFLSGYISPGLTINEPAIAIAITIVIVVSNLVRGNVSGLALGRILPYFIALSGAKLGERMQA